MVSDEDVLSKLCNDLEIAKSAENCPPLYCSMDTETTMKHAEDVGLEELFIAGSPAYIIKKGKSKLYPQRLPFLFSFATLHPETYKMVSGSVLITAETATNIQRLINATIPIVHNLKFDRWQLDNVGVKMHRNFFDTAVLAKLVRPFNRDNSLDNLCNVFDLPVQKLDYFKKGSKGLPKSGDYHDYYLYAPEKMLEYAKVDAEADLLLFRELMKEVKALGIQQDVLLNMRTLDMLYRMERRGLKLDFAKIERDRVALNELKANILLSGILPDSFNYNSPKQILSFVKQFDYGKHIWKTDKGEPSTDGEALKGIHDRIDDEYGKTAIKTIVRLQKIDKLKSTFIDGLLELAQGERVYPIYNIATQEKRGGKESDGGTKTGRLSSSTPNIQQVPKRGFNTYEHAEWGEDFYYPRQYFMSEPEAVLLFCDYDQQEYRMLGALSKDSKMKSLIDSGYDVHTATASMIYGIPPEEVSSEQRSIAKSVLFGICYGMGLGKLANSIGGNIDLERYGWYTHPVAKSMAKHNCEWGEAEDRYVENSN